MVLNRQLRVIVELLPTIEWTWTVMWTCRVYGKGGKTRVL